MTQKQKCLRFYSVFFSVVLAWTAPAVAVFHFADVVEIYSNADGSVQYIEYQMTTDFQNLLAGHAVTSNGNTLNITTDLPSSATANRSWLLATNAFTALPGAVTPDYVIPENFFSLNGDTITLVDGAFAPMIFGSGVLPVDGINALRKNLTTGVNSPTNFAGQTGSVDTSPVDFDNLFVNFGLALNGNGADVAPFNNMVDAVAVANPGATINLVPGSSSETFTGASSITKQLTLVNSDPGLGSVTIGQGGAPARSEEPEGFVSRTKRSPNN